METKKALRSLGFQVVRKIGEGSFGKVMLATSKKYPDQVAIKTTDLKLMKPGFVSKFLPRELAILRKVQHPHIVQVRDILELSNRHVFIVMEAAATDLCHMIQELHHIPIDQAKRWFSQLVSAVVYLHQQNIVHRDLKCSNVLLTADDRIKLTDFSLVRISRGFPDLSETYCGTPHYAAPEVLLHEPYDPKRSDVWSLGVILYTMVTGSLPFDSNNLKRLPHHQKQPLKYPDGVTVDEPCKNFISYMLKFHYYLRPSAAEVAQHQWLQLPEDREKIDTDKALRSLGFEVLGNIQEGSFGKIKLATSKKHPKQVAIKIVDRILMEPDLETKFLPRELDILKTVMHPHIVQVHDIFEMPNHLVFIVMEAAATDLHQKIQELHHIPVDQAKKWFSQLVSAVDYLHEQDIVHRDLTCSNVLLTADGQIKLTGFRFGRISKGSPEESKTYCCTSYYTAPEVLLATPYEPKKSDVWSLGVILYVMLTGSRPYDHTDLKELPNLQQRPLNYPEGMAVEESCQDLIAYMLQFRPFFRPSVTQVAQHPWLQSSQEHEMSETADSSVAEAKSAPQESVFGFPERLCDESCKEIQQQQQNTIKHLEKIRVIGRFVVEAVDEDGEPSSHGDVSPLHEDDSSRAGASLTCRSVEAVEEEHGCLCCSPFCAAVKRAAKAYVVTPIIRASHSLRGKVKMFFISAVHNSSSSQQGAPHSAASTEAPACSSPEQRREDGTSDILFHGLVVETEAVLPQPTVRQGRRRLRFPKFKILKKRVHPL
ncbi:ribosomal protein S6 kinase alpha-3-like [Salminus brasiliensis]|uniref:ribosomal protein S6 kinase alpha-3-like n=1 Tax=Salminus brasiliensis TaxID=930266 RepID=UPI003B839E38